MKKLRLTVLAVAMVATGFAWAQPAGKSDEEEKPSLSLADIQNGASAGGVLSAASPEDLKRAESNAKEAVRSILDAYQRNLPAHTQQMAPLRRKSDQIADEALQAERDKALEFLGLDPQSNTAVSIFLSWSMPLELMRAYVLDAMWSGASIYFRGVPPGKDLVTFIQKDLRTLVYGKNAANISIDPRMFDAFQVTTVPTIIYSTTRDQFNCKGVAPRSFIKDEKALTYDTCNSLPDEAYWKISGAVSTSYALGLFLENNAPGIKPYVDALSKGYAQGVPPGKDQGGYTGKWEDVLSPADLEMNRRYDERVKEEAAKKAAADKTTAR